jgi:hypothetical protein
MMIMMMMMTGRKEKERETGRTITIKKRKIEGLYQLVRQIMG